MFSTKAHCSYLLQTLRLWTLENEPFVATPRLKALAGHPWKEITLEPEKIMSFSGLRGMLGGIASRILKDKIAAAGDDIDKAFMALDFLVVRTYIMYMYLNVMPVYHCAVVGLYECARIGLQLPDSCVCSYIKVALKLTFQVQKPLGVRHMQALVQEIKTGKPSPDSPTDILHTNSMIAMKEVGYLFVGEYFLPSELSTDFWGYPEQRKRAGACKTAA